MLLYVWGLILECLLQLELTYSAVNCAGERTWLCAEEIVVLITAVSCCLAFHRCNGTYEWVESTQHTDMLMLKALMEPCHCRQDLSAHGAINFAAVSKREKERERGRVDCPLEKRCQQSLLSYHLPRWLKIHWKRSDASVALNWHKPFSYLSGKKNELDFLQYNTIYIDGCSVIYSRWDIVKDSCIFIMCFPF